MDHGWCASPVVCRRRDGTAAGVNRSGLTLALALCFPGPTLDDGHGTARLSLADTATAAQRSALASIMPGKRGGPLPMLAGLITTWRPTQTAPSTVQEANGTMRATVGRGGQLHFPRRKHEAGPPMTRQNVGLAVAWPFDRQTAELAPRAGTRGSDPDRPRPWEAKSGAVDPFTWRGSSWWAQVKRACQLHAPRCQGGGLHHWG